MNGARFADLRGIANSLAKDNRYRRLNSIIKSAGIAQSCLADLRQATDYCTLLTTMHADGVPRTESYGTLQNALMLQAVILYARATMTSGSSGERGAIKIETKLEPQSLVDHKLLISIRNRAVAHVYAGEQLAGQIWHKEGLLLIHHDRKFTPTATTTRVGFHGPTLACLERQIPVAISFVRQRFDHHMDQAMTIFETNGLLKDTFDKNLVNPHQYYSSDEAIQDALNSIPAGFAKSTTVRRA
jgi:hypothetical protein